MKLYILFLSIFLHNLNCYSQSLEGEWKIYDESNKITLNFHKISDSTYVVYSHSTLLVNGTKVDAICKLTGYFSKDSVFLEEVETISPKDFKEGCFQKMYLCYKERKKGFELSGLWDSTNCDMRVGRIYFWKKKP